MLAHTYHSTPVSQIVAYHSYDSAVRSEELADVLGVGVAAGQLRPQHEAVVGQVAGQAPSQGQGPHPAQGLHEYNLSEE